MSDFMRKRLFIIGLLLAVLCSKTLVYAKDENLWEMRLYGWYVMMDDIFDLNKLYQDNRNMSSIEASEFLAGRALSYRREIYTQTEKLAAENMGYVRRDMLILNYIAECQIRLMEELIVRLYFFL